jgi:hypothetical protein
MKKKQSAAPSKASTVVEDTTLLTAAFEVERLHIAATLAVDEALRGRLKHGNKDFRSRHEGYAILKEEVDEAWQEIKHGTAANAKKEMIQVAAMALRFISEL